MKAWIQKDRAGERKERRKERKEGEKEREAGFGRGERSPEEERGYFHFQNCFYLPLPPSQPKLSDLRLLQWSMLDLFWF